MNAYGIWCASNMGVNRPYTLQTYNNKFVILDSGNSTIWSANIAFDSFTGASLVMQDDGTLVLYDGLGLSRWYQGIKTYLYITSLCIM